MYKNLYSAVYTVNKWDIGVIILPNFKEDITIINDNTKITTSSGEYYTKTDSKYNHAKRLYVKVPKSTKWIIVTQPNLRFTQLFITEHTEEIIIDGANERSQILTSLIKATKDAYLEKKNEEVRLYFWNSSKGSLTLCTNYNNIDHQFPYYMNPLGNQIIDRTHSIPGQDCFIFGKILKTIGASQSQLLSFIAPLCIITPDFPKDKWHFMKYRSNINSLEKILLNLFFFCIKYSQNAEMSEERERVLSYLRKIYHSTSPDMQIYVDEIKKAFNECDTNRLRMLEGMISTTCDC